LKTALVGRGGAGREENVKGGGVNVKVGLGMDENVKGGGVNVGA